MLYENFERFDVAHQQNDNKADGKISSKDLRAAASNKNDAFSGDMIDAAQYLLDNPSDHDQLDVANNVLVKDKAGKLDDRIGRADLEAALHVGSRLHERDSPDDDMYAGIAEMFDSYGRADGNQYPLYSGYSGEEGKRQQASLAPAADGTWAQRETANNGTNAIDRDIAGLAKATYSDVAADGETIHGWDRLGLDEAKRELRLSDDVVLKDPSTGFDAAIFKKDKAEGATGSDQYVLSFRGTEPTSLADWKTNFGQAMGGMPAQYKQAVQLAKEVSLGTTEFARVEGGVTQFDNGNLIIAGHSLGGGLATAAAAATRKPAVTFNAAGVRDGNLKSIAENNPTYNGDEKKSGGAIRELMREGQVRGYHVEGEFLAGLQSVPGLPSAAGNIIDMNTGYSAWKPWTWSPVGYHSMNSVLEGMDKMDNAPWNA